MDAGQNPLVDSVLYAVLKSHSITGEILEMLLNGAVPKVDSMFKYAKTDYTLGLPQGCSGSMIGVSNETVALIIIEDLGLTDDIIVDYNFISELTASQAVLPALTRERGYDIATNIITIYPADMVITPTGVAVVTDAVISEDGTYVTFLYIIFEWAYVGDSQEQELVAVGSYEEAFDCPANLVIGKVYCIAKYNKLDSAGNMLPEGYYWYYDVDTNLYPAISPEYSRNAEDTFLPVIPMRYKNKDLTADAYRETDLFKTSKKLLKKSGVDIDVVAGLLNDNPDVGEMDNAYIMFGINMQTEYSPSIRYLVEFFDYLHDISAVKEADYLDSLLTGDFTKNQYIFSDFDRGINYEDVEGEDDAQTTVTEPISLTEKGLDVRITYSYITSEILPGNIGSPGTATMVKEKIPGDVSVSACFGGLGGCPDKSKVILELQITDILIKRVVVYGLDHYNMVYGNHSVYTAISTIIDDEDNNNLVIPVHYGIASRIPMWPRNMLYIDSFQIIINCYVKTKVHWYEKGWFKIVIWIVAIVITIWTSGSSLWLTSLMQFGAGTIGFAALLLAILPSILWGVAISMVLKYAVKEFGIEFAFILAVIMLAASFFDFGDMSLFGFSIPTAQLCLQISSALVTSASGIMTEQMANLIEELQYFREESSELWEELEDKWDALERKSTYDPLLFVEPPRFSVVPNESPTAFFDRTIHNGNVGVVVLDVIPNFCTVALKLPEVPTSTYNVNLR